MEGNQVEDFDKNMTFIEKLQSEVQIDVDEGNNLIASFHKVDNELEMKNENAPTKRSLESTKSSSLTLQQKIDQLNETDKSNIMKQKSKKKKTELLKKVLQGYFDSLPPAGKEYVERFSTEDERFQALKEALARKQQGLL